MAGTCATAPHPIGKNNQQILRMMFASRNLVSLVFLVCALGVAANAQSYSHGYTLGPGGTADITNHSGRVEVQAVPVSEGDTAGAENVKITASGDKKVYDDDVRIAASGMGIIIEVKPGDTRKRIDLKIEVPERIKLRIDSGDGEARISGNLESVEITTQTGTISADIPTDDVKYDFLWTEARPRFVSDIVLDDVKEKSAGRFSLKGTIINGVGTTSHKKDRKDKKEEPLPNKDENNLVNDPAEDLNASEAADNKKTKKTKTKNPKAVSLKFETARGIVLLNVPASEVASDLRERPLTNAAKAIVRSGDSFLMDAIRRTSPKYFGDYLKTLPPIKRQPRFSDRQSGATAAAASIKSAIVSVTDINNRSISDIKADEFEVLENNEPREVTSIRSVTAPFNLVLLLDVSGSVDSYVNFIRKAARSFVETVGSDDRISIVTFNEDVHVISSFSGNKQKLSESLDTFDAGGGTAFYDALAYTLTDTLRPLKGERTAIVVLTDGDDNRSFLAFNSLLGSIQESGALIYPLYVPSGLIAAGANNDPNAGVDPLRAKYMGLTTKAKGEGLKLAEISGGQYYPITQLSQIKAAYDDIVRQLRTAYSVTYKSTLAETNAKSASPRLKIKVKRDNAFVKVNSVAVLSK